jgi:mRNA-degrading endonuclease RelE of RelBE toxin-antitoxin system
MYTVVETLDFQKDAAKIWTQSELADFIGWIAANPLAGDVIPATHGARKVRWSVQGRGKRGGVRVIYFAVTNQGVLVLIAIYTKNEQTNMSAKDINDIGVKKPT